MSKKKRKDVKAKQRQKRMQKRKKARAKTRQAGQMSPRSPSLSHFMGREPMGEMDAPDGFRPITATQAMIEFGQPVFDSMEDGSTEAVNKAFGLVTLLWNFAIKCEQQGKEDGGKTRKDFINELANATKKPKNEIESLIEMMLARKAWLFPPEIQPEFKMTMFIRKEESIDIPSFTETDLVSAPCDYEPNLEDEALVNRLHELDEKVSDLDYSEWEPDFNRVQCELQRRFFLWLEPRVRPEHLDHLADVVEPYINFLYCYAGVHIDSPSTVHLDEFFQDHVLRKIHMDDPVVYAKWPIALELFYDYLRDIEYINNNLNAREEIDAVAAGFISTLRRFYG